MTYVTDILDTLALTHDIRDGYIRVRSHPEFPELSIYNYTEKTAYEGAWTNERLVCRGLIVNTETGKVLARPFSKFFNYGQTGAPDIDLDAAVYYVGDKFDGSLGIGYMRPDGELAIATRGSFDSEQARHATALLSVLGDEWTANNVLTPIYDGFTPLFEIVYPENRIVVDYGSLDALIPLGVVSVKRGWYNPPLNAGDEHTISMRSVLALEPRKNAEGYVVWLDSMTAVKIKYETYIELHRIVTGLNRKSVWRALSQGQDVFQAMLEQLPDELYKWAETVAKELNEQYAEEMREIDGWYVSTLDQDVWEDENDLLNYEIDRRAFALTVKANVPAKYQGYMFSLLDRRDIQAKLWASLEPIGGER